MVRRPAKLGHGAQQSTATIEHVELPDRELKVIGPTHPVWKYARLEELDAVELRAIVWVKPPNVGVDSKEIAAVARRLRERGAFVRLEPMDRVTDALGDQPTAPVLTVADARPVVRAIVEQLCKRDGVSRELALLEAEECMSGAGL